MLKTNWWFGMTRDIGLLAVESGEVMWLRTLKLARGGKPALDEFQLMVTEKVEATVQLQCRLLTGKLGPSKQAAARGALDHVRRKVRANRSRLRG